MLRTLLRRHDSESSVSKESNSELPSPQLLNVMSASESSVAAIGDSDDNQLSFSDSCQSLAAVAATAQNFEYKNALEELIATEKKYVHRLELLSDHYYPRVSAELPRRAAQLKEIFAKFSTLKKLHQELLLELELVSEESGSGKRLGPLMYKYGHHLRLYSVYYTKYMQHLNQIKKWMHDETFGRVFQRAKNDCPESADRMLDVTSHMLEPVQRPLRYPLLMERYLKEIGENHPDYQDAKRALDLIKKVTDSFNVKMFEVEKREKLRAILRQVTFPSELQAEKEKIMRSQYLLSSNVLKISSKNRQQIRFIILCSSLLLVCEVNALRKTVQCGVPVDQNLVLTLDEKLSADYPNSVRLKTQHKTYDISFSSQDEFDKWIAAFKRLNVTFGDSSAGNEKFPWKTLADNDVGKKQPMKLKDYDVSQCQACTDIFTLTRRRHHCRLCGGIFCGRCSKYTCAVAWANGEHRRSCFFCLDRINRRDKRNYVLEEDHRKLIEKFDRRSEGSGARIQGYLIVHIDVHQAKKDNSPAFLHSGWHKMWCTVEDEAFYVYRMKKDFVAVHTVVLPMNLTVKLSDDATEICLQLADISDCRLRMTEESVLRSAEREASHLQEWYDIFKTIF